MLILGCDGECLESTSHTYHTLTTPHTSHQNLTEIRARVINLIRNCISSGDGVRLEDIKSIVFFLEDCADEVQKIDVLKLLVDLMHDQVSLFFEFFLCCYWSCCCCWLYDAICLLTDIHHDRPLPCSNFFQIYKMCRWMKLEGQNGSTIPNCVFKLENKFVWCCFFCTWLEMSDVLSSNT